MKFPDRAEFIVLIAGITMAVAFGIDTMLPALPAIRDALHAPGANDAQFVITAFTIGLGIAQFVVGILSDSFGRRRLLIGSLVLYVLCCVAASRSSSFHLLLAARLVQGLAAGGARVVAVSIVRDRFAGRDMAQVMSFVSVVFMAAPVVAPFFGTLMLQVAHWNAIFDALALIATALTVWVILRLPETLATGDRVRLALAPLGQSMATVLRDRQAVGYTLALTLLSCCIFAFLTSVQQVYAQALHRAAFLPIGFAIMALTMAAASFVNARIVMRFGMRRIGHLAIVGFIAFALIHLIVAASGHETLVSFVALQAAMMACFPLAVGNFGALAMERMGHVAGTASSLQGSFSTVVGTVGGSLIGQQFDGTTLPLYLGTAGAALAALVVIWVTEGGRMFVPGPAAEAA